MPAMPAASPRSFARIALTILWPSFLVAGVQEALVFVVVDPHALHWFGASAIEWSAKAVYTVTFLIFWFSTASAGALSCLLMSPPSPPSRWP